ITYDVRDFERDDVDIGIRFGTGKYPGLGSASRWSAAGPCYWLTPTLFPKADIPDMAPPLLNLDGIKLTFGGTPLLDGAALSAADQRDLLAGGRA
uniref:hypothetical protein n=1 Tax=Mesorhizobium sp. M2D.F.Ca.ET.225.01.1.1 TaxID=2563942 RepID=UPI00167C173D